MWRRGRQRRWRRRLEQRVARTVVVVRRQPVRVAARVEHALPVEPSPTATTASATGAAPPVAVQRRPAAAHGGRPVVAHVHAAAQPFWGWRLA